MYCRFIMSRSRLSIEYIVTDRCRSMTQVRRNNSLVTPSIASVASLMLVIEPIQSSASKSDGFSLINESVTRVSD
jgi:hypothetical protein